MAASHSPSDSSHSNHGTVNTRTAPVVVARRSRKGCYTCRAAKKRCPEDFDSTGQCSRCISRNNHCEREKSLRVKGSNPQTKIKRQQKTIESIGTDENASDQDELEGIRTKVAKIASRTSASAPTEAIAGSSAVSHESSSNPVSSRQTNGITPGLINASEQTNDVTIKQYNAPIAADATPSQLSHPWHDLFRFLEDPLLPTQIHSGANHAHHLITDTGGPVYAGPLAGPAPCPPTYGPTAHWPVASDPAQLELRKGLSAPSSQSLNPSHQPQCGHEALFDPTSWQIDLDSLLWSPGTALDELSAVAALEETPPMTTTAMTTAALAESISEPDALEDDPVDNEAGEMTHEMASVYATINTEFLRFMPSETREVVRARWYDLSRSTELGKAASAAIVLLHILRRQDAETDAAGNADDATKAMTANAARAKLLARSNRYFERAVQHLADPAVTLEARLNAVLDMYYHQLDSAGAVAAASLLLIGELFLTDALGPRPALDLNARDVEVGRPQSLPLRLFAYLDVFRSVASAGRHTLFEFAGLPGDVNGFGSGTGTKDSNGGWGYFSLPREMLLCLAASSNLAVEAAEGLDPGIVRTKAEAIERAVRGWRPQSQPIVNSGQLDNSWTLVCDLATKEMAALIHLHQTVHRASPRSPTIRASLSQILVLTSNTQPQLFATPISRGFLRACPLFLAATVALETTERAVLRSALNEQGLEARVHRDNAEAVEWLWRDVDERSRGEANNSGSGATANAALGENEDWRKRLQDNGIVVAFM